MFLPLEGCELVMEALRHHSTRDAIAVAGVPSTASTSLPPLRWELFFPRLPFFDASSCEVLAIDLSTVSPVSPFSQALSCPTDLWRRMERGAPRVLIGHADSPSPRLLSQHSSSRLRSTAPISRCRDSPEAGCERA
jgi:hypothetical protein